MNDGRKRALGRLVPRSLRGRLALGAAVAAGLAMSLVGAAVVATVARSERSALDDSLREQGEGLQAAALAATRFGLLDQSPGSVPLAGVQQLASGVLGGENRVVRLLDGDTVLFALGPVPTGGLAATGPGCATIAAREGHWRSCTTAVQGRLRLQAASSLRPVGARIARVRRVAVIVAVAGVVAVAALAWGLAGLALRPLTALREGARRVSGTHDLRQRLPEAGGPDEVRALADSLNAMLGRLEVSSARTQAALDAAQRFTADAGHELRTPLMALRTDVDTLRRNPGLPAQQRAEVLDALHAEQAQLTGLLEALQALARGDAGVTGARETVDLAAIAANALGAARRRHPGIQWRLHAEGAEVRGVWDGLRMAVDNLLENAARHGRPDGRVDVTVGPQDGGARLVVDDEGPGIPVAERERVFDRFSRGTAALGDGSGLGLAIVAQQAALHGGAVLVIDAPLGGARVTLTLPRTDG